MRVKLASAEQPADPGSTGPKWAAEEQHWVPLFNSTPEVPISDSSHVSRNSCARLRHRVCRRQCEERDVVRCLESLNWLAGRRDRSVGKRGNGTGCDPVTFQRRGAGVELVKLVYERCNLASAIPLPQAALRELLGSRSVCGPDENGNSANFSTVELVSLLDSLSGCPRLCDVVP